MSSIDFDNGTFSVDAALLAECLGLEPVVAQRRMRAGQITSRCERGFDEDAGRYRLTFYHGRRRLRLVVDETGTIIERTLERIHRAAGRSTQEHRC